MLFWTCGICGHCEKEPDTHKDSWFTAHLGRIPPLCPTCETFMSRDKVEAMPCYCKRCVDDRESTQVRDSLNWVPLLLFFLLVVVVAAFVMR